MVESFDTFNLGVSPLKSELSNSSDLTESSLAEFESKMQRIINECYSLQLKQMRGEIKKLHACLKSEQLGEMDEE